MKDLWNQLPASLNKATLQTLAADTSLDLLHSLLSDFAEELTSQLQQVEAGVASATPDVLANAFHTTKGLAATFGADTLRTLCESLEESTKTIERSQLPELSRTFAKVVGDTQNDVSTALELIKGDNG